MAQGRLLILDSDSQVGRMIQMVGQSAGFEARILVRPGEMPGAVSRWRPTHVAVDLSKAESRDALVSLATLGCSVRIIVTCGTVGTDESRASAKPSDGAGLDIVGVLSRPFSPQALRLLLLQPDASPSLLDRPDSALNTRKAVRGLTSGHGSGCAQPSPVTCVQGGCEIVLLVDDDALLRRVIAEMLDSLGYRVLPTENATEALSILRRGDAIDLLMTDMTMPGGMNGVELASIARALRSSLKVLYCSGDPGRAIVEQAHQDPAVALLAKPFRLGELARSVREVLDRN